jgi:predicted unusual protein kinase regulating ubiquinone biosynthesis (AarF/ABC1/UbiB family)
MSGKEPKKVVDINLPVLKERTDSLLRGAGDLAWSTVKLPSAFLPLAQLLLSQDEIHRDTLAEVLDNLFAILYKHPISYHSKSLTLYLRKYRLIPNEESTENLIRFLVKQTVSRSPVEIPDVIIDEFWSFFHELISAPELKGLVELNLDIIRLVLRTYEPLLVELINKVKQIRRLNQVAVSDMMLKVKVLRGDLVILRRQIKAIRYIKPFLQTDPKDFGAQAEIVAKMVREFGPLFIKMAQVAAANSDFLPEEIASELKVFQEDVDPMTPDEVNQAFIEEYGKKPNEIYFNFDVQRPLKSGSIGSVYLARKPVMRNGVEVLETIVVKVARHNIEREFQMGSLAIELMLISSQYWAPHSKLLPFLNAMSQQIKEFTKGFEQELNFVEEAEIQKRFADRASNSHVWHVPKIFRVSGRILEMEFLENAKSINQAIAEYSGDKKLQFQRRIAENFVFTILEHLIVHQEFHGDLHPGNIMIGPDAELFLIDWGNAVDMQGKWGLIWNYLVSVLAGDTNQLTQILINMSKDREKNQLRFNEIKKALDETLLKKNIKPLDRKFVKTLYVEGREGIYRRFQTVMQLMSNTYQLGIVVESDYLHLSRSIVAMVGSYLNMYKGVSKFTMSMDFLKSFLLFPLHFTKDKISLKKDEMTKKLAESDY